jgi:RNA polymerase sigma-70 factor (sigma-E family)
VLRTVYCSRPFVKRNAQIRHTLVVPGRPQPAWATFSNLIRVGNVTDWSGEGGVPEQADFAVFVAARSQRLLRTAYLLTRDWYAAEDLLQTALAKSWFAWGRLRSDDPEAYVRKVLVTTYASAWRRRWRGEVPSAQLPEHLVADLTGIVDERDAMWRALGQLPRRQRAVVVLRYFEDLTEAQTADILGCSVGTVKSQTAKALAKLRNSPELTSGRATREQH